MIPEQCIFHSWLSASLDLELPQKQRHTEVAATINWQPGAFRRHKIDL